MKGKDKGALISFAIVMMALSAGAAGSRTPDSQGSATMVMPRFCTQEAMICPDGTAVGRVGPDCEFAPCPEIDPKIMIRLYPGWNLISLPGKGELSPGDCTNGNLYGFVYLEETGHYETIAEAEEEIGSDALWGHVSKNAFWAYSYEKCTMSLLPEKATLSSEISLKQGWNYVPITKDMEGKELSAVSGGCAIARAYYWDGFSQSWKAIGEYDRLSIEGDQRGIAIDSNGFCTLGQLPPSPQPADE